jgi:hypothetical protein
MSDKNLPVPDFIDVSPEVASAASAAMSFNTVLTTPEEAVSNTDKKGNLYTRWSEPAVIDNAWREVSDKGLVTAVVQLKIRVGSHNSGVRVWARHMLNLQVLAGVASEADVAKYQFMNDKAINALTTLLNATGFMPETGGLSSKVMNFLFPVKNAPGAVTPLRGKAVVVNLADVPNKGEKAKTPRQTTVESYLPDSVE